MKIKLFLTCLLASVATGFASIVVDDSVVFDKPITLAERDQMLAKLGVTPGQMALPFVPARMDEGVRVFSVTASTSTYTTIARANTMAWMVGITVPTDRTANPAACYQIPDEGLQWFDFVTTGYKSWLGSTMFQSQAVTNENGHRIIVSAAGKYPVGDYWCRIVSTSTNMGSAYFPVSTNTSTHQEIQFNLNFPAIDLGVDKTLNSFYDTTLGRWVQGGDDHVYINGEWPSQVQYDWWYRFGATIQKNLALPGDVSVVKGEFVSGEQSLTCELVRPSMSTNGIGTAIVKAAVPVIALRDLGGQNLRAHIIGGQVGILYRVMSTIDLNEPVVWTEFIPGATFSSGVEFDIGSTDPHRFFRLLGANP